MPYKGHEVQLSLTINVNSQQIAMKRVCVGNSTFKCCICVFFFFPPQLLIGLLWTVHKCTVYGSHKLHFLSTFSLKMGSTVLFTHLKIILLQYFLVFSFQSTPCEKYDFCLYDCKCYGSQAFFIFLSRWLLL